MKNLFLFLSVFFIVFLSVNQIEVSAQSENGMVYEKIYLHIDREMYAPGDDIWFKAYLINGLNNQLIPGYKNFYVQLISESGKVIVNRLLIIQNGTAKGDFSIPETLEKGTYIIQAYTLYQKNFGEESFFHKSIYISGGKNSVETVGNSKQINSNSIDVSFLPEGGNFVLNAVNIIAFKAINKSGVGIPVKGKVVDGSGIEIISFETSYKGMGTFEITPAEGKNYFVKLDYYPEFTYKFEPANTSGIGLNYEQNGDDLLFVITRNSENVETQELLFKVMHKDIVVFSNQITLTENRLEQSVMGNFFPVGISKITISNQQNNIIAERLVFVRDKKENSIQMSVNKNEYTTREKVEIEIKPNLARRDTVLSTLSVAVVNENYFGVTGNNQTIESYLLIESELKGAIESPASCFIVEDNISVDEKLDLVMMINGWRSYYWDYLDKFVGTDLPHWEDLGVALSGNVVSLNGKKPVVGGQVILSPFVGGLTYEETTTDKLGNFSFDGLLLKDSAMVIIDAKTKKGSKKTETVIAQPQIFETKVDFSEIKFFDLNDNSSKFYSENFARLKAQQEYSLTGETIFLDDIKITGQRKLSDGHFRLYGEPDVSMNVIEDGESYSTILDYLEGRVAGLLRVGPRGDDYEDGISIRNSGRNPLLLVDGLAAMSWDDIGIISMNDIDKIEILKTGFATAIYGSRGGNGVISILTKVGDKSYEFERNAVGRTTPYVQGYSQSRIFYSPKYTLENKNDPKPDLRPTLYWNAEMQIENGIGKVEFYTADKLANYLIIVEGISKKGRICYGSQILSVSVPK